LIAESACGLSAAFTKIMKKSTIFLVLIVAGLAGQNLFAGGGGPPGPPAVPEPATWLAGALVLVPSGMSTLRVLRQKRSMKKRML
jgi:hypothetical protein